MAARLVGTWTPSRRAAVALTAAAALALMARRLPAQRTERQGERTGRYGERSYTSDEAQVEGWERRRDDSWSLPIQARIVIDTQEQLDYAKVTYGLGDCGYFLEVLGRHPIEDHLYLLEYELALGGYHTRIDGLEDAVSGIRFVKDQSSLVPATDDGLVSGYLHMAALPRPLGEGAWFSNAIRPGERQEGGARLTDEAYAALPRYRGYGRDDGVQFESWVCDRGVMSDDRRQVWGLVAIDTQEQLEYAEAEYGLASFGPLRELVRRCPLEGNFYLLSHEEIWSGWSPEENDWVDVDDDGTTFMRCGYVGGPGRGDETGLIHMAAISRPLMDGSAVGRAIYPGVFCDDREFVWRPHELGIDETRASCFPCRPSDGVSMHDAATVVIDSQEQLDYAKREWGLADFEPLGAMVGERPLESNFYLLSYSSRPTGNPRVSGVLVGHDTIFFLWDKNCPALSADLSRDACGVIYLAAVPRTYADGRAFRYVIYPGESDSEVLS